MPAAIFPCFSGCLVCRICAKSNCNRTYANEIVTVIAQSWCNCNLNETEQTVIDPCLDTHSVSFHGLSTSAKNCKYSKSAVNSTGVQSLCLPVGGLGSVADTS